MCGGCESIETQCVQVLGPGSWDGEGTWGTLGGSFREKRSSVDCFPSYPPVAVALNATKPSGSHADTCSCIEIFHSCLKVFCAGVIETTRILL